MQEPNTLSEPGVLQSHHCAVFAKPRDSNSRRPYCHVTNSKLDPESTLLDRHLASFKSTDERRIPDTST